MLTTLSSPWVRAATPTGVPRHGDVNETDAEISSRSDKRTVPAAIFTYPFAGGTTHTTTRPFGEPRVNRAFHDVRFIGV